MHESRLDPVAQRLERLEREARWWRLGGLALGGLLAVVGLIGATPATSEPTASDVRAQQFTLVDTRGNVRAVLGMTKTGTAGLDLYGRAGKILAQLAVKPDGAPQLTLLDRTGAGRAVVALELDGSPHLTLRDEKGTTRAVLGHASFEASRTALVTRRSAASLILAEKEGNVLFKAP
jgi:hypothetical protein